MATSASSSKPPSPCRGAPARHLLRAGRVVDTRPAQKRRFVFDTHRRLYIYPKETTLQVHCSLFTTTAVLMVLSLLLLLCAYLCQWQRD